MIIKLKSTTYDCKPANTLFICFSLFNLLSITSIDQINGQLTNSETTLATVSSKNESKIESKLATGTISENPQSFNASDITLLSSEDFVDSKDVPTILYDGISNETPDEHKNISAAHQNSNESSQVSNQLSNKPSSNRTTTSTTTAIESSPNEAATSISVNSTTTSSPTTTGPSISIDETDDINDNDEDGDLLSDNQEDGTKEDSSTNFEMPQNISQYMDYIEKLFHDLRHQITDLFEPHIPQLIRTSRMVELSSSCSYDMLRFGMALRRFEPWALRMIDSSGKVPEGIFEGSFTALGSYDECLNTIFQPTNFHTASASRTSATTSDYSGNQITNGDKSVQTQGQYCLVTLSPFMPPKPPVDKVERMFQDEANRRNYTKDDQFSRLSPMFYYMKFRIGVCIPSTCQQSDMESISSALSSSLRLNITIPDCRVKQANVPLTQAQFTGGLIFASVVVIVLSATLWDYLKMTWQKIKSQEMRLRDEITQGSYMIQAGKQHTFLNNKNEQIKIRIRQISAADRDIDSSSWSNFERRLQKHWSWLSFSMLTNFRLYFQQDKSQQKSICQECKVNSKDQVERPNSDKFPVTGGSINCLNGIRTLSLCWIIIANSYLTLDPRATKRLSKTREAPRDFLFQLIVQASLAIETFFFLSGLLMSLSFAKKFRANLANDQDSQENKDSKVINNSSSKNISEQENSTLLVWLQFYIHRYVRITPPTMLVIALSMYAYHFGDGPLWFEATQRVHQSCSQNWWRHLLHVANFIDTRQMCFIHYWYIAADMQLFLFAPLIMFLLFKCRKLGYALISFISLASIGLLFYLTYNKNLPPTLLFYNSDPESRREFGNTIMTKPFAHVLPYIVGMLVGWYLLNTKTKKRDSSNATRPLNVETDEGKVSMAGLGGLLVTIIALTELFLPYKWNNSHLPSRLFASIYAALFRLGWSLVLAYIVISCRHRRSRACYLGDRRTKNINQLATSNCNTEHHAYLSECRTMSNQYEDIYCFCSSGGNHLNRLLSLNIFAHLSRLSFIAYLIHLPLMSVFIGQTRGLFAFSHALVIHLAISYLVMVFLLSFVLVHIIELPFLTFERKLFDRLTKRTNQRGHNMTTRTTNMSTTSTTN